MPGNVTPATPVAVLPNHLCALFREMRVWSVRESGGYPDGRYQAEPQAVTSRKSWEITKLLTFAQWLELRTFFDARNGSQQAFHWYPLVADYDPTGASMIGRWLVRFDGALSRTYRLGRQEIGLRLLQVE